MHAARLIWQPDPFSFQKLHDRSASSEKPFSTTGPFLQKVLLLILVTKHKLPAWCPAGCSACAWQGVLPHCLWLCMTAQALPAAFSLLAKPPAPSPRAVIPQPGVQWGWDSLYLHKVFPRVKEPPAKAALWPP